MPKLKNSKIYRGGVTASDLDYETNECSVSVNQGDATLDIRFNLASKGGGTTSVLLQIGKEDFQVILREIATKIPDTVGVISDCASIANKKNLELLAEARKVHDDEKARAKSLIEDLEPVEDFINEKWKAAPVGKDEEEEQMRDRIQKVMSVLRELW